MVAAAAEAVVAPDLHDVEADARARARRGCRGSARCCATARHSRRRGCGSARASSSCPCQRGPSEKTRTCLSLHTPSDAAAVADDVVVEVGDDVPALRLGIIGEDLAAEQPLLLARQRAHRRSCRGICASTAPAPPRSPPRCPSRRRWRRARRRWRSSTSVTRLSIWPVMMTTSLGRSVPRWMATTLHTLVGVGTRGGR